MSFREDKQWADRFRGEVEAIIRRHVGLVVTVRLADDHEDAKQATDMVVEVVGGTIAVRIRDDTRDFRDWTVRTSRASGVRTEIDKLREGFARWYLYAWCLPGNRSLSPSRSQGSLWSNEKVYRRICTGVWDRRHPQQSGE